MAEGRWWDDVTGGQPPPANLEMPRRFTRYLRWTWPVAVAACIPATAWLGDPGWAAAGGVWFAVGWCTLYQMDRVEWNAKRAGHSVE